MAKNFKVVKLDGRYKGGQAFKYLIDYRVVDDSIADPHRLRLYQDQFLGVHRIWFWESYGPSAEIEPWMVAKLTQFKTDLANTNGLKLFSDNWAWHTDYGYKRIYVKDDETLSAFLLKYQN